MELVMTRLTLKMSCGLARHGLLWSLLLAVTLVLSACNSGTPSDSGGSKLPEAVKSAAMQLEELGASVEVEKGSGPRSIRVDFAEPAKDEDLVHLKNLNDLGNLQLVGSNITNEGLKQIGQLTSLRVLNLAKTDVSDEGLQYL